MLSSLFDEQALRKQYDIAMREEIRKEMRDEIMKNAVIVLKRHFTTFDSLTEIIMEIFKIDKPTATDKVSAYWN